MAGVINAPGNVSPVAEANIANDPDAAKVVFNGKTRSHSSCDFTS
jgi:purine nucleosidase